MRWRRQIRLSVEPRHKEKRQYFLTQSDFIFLPTAGKCLLLHLTTASLCHLDKRHSLIRTRTRTRRSSALRQNHHEAEWLQFTSGLKLSAAAAEKNTSDPTNTHRVPTRLAVTWIRLLAGVDSTNPFRLNQIKVSDTGPWSPSACTNTESPSVWAQRDDLHHRLNGWTACSHSSLKFSFCSTSLNFSL